MEFCYVVAQRVLELTRGAVELMGWGILAFFLMLSIKERYRALRRKGIEAMHLHTKGVCDGAVAAGLHPWSVPGDMMFSGGRGVLSYAPKDLEGNGPELDGPALIVLGVAGQEEVFGTATIIWSEGPPLPWYYLERKSRRHFVTASRRLLLTLGYEAGFKIGQRLGAQVLRMKSPLTNPTGLPLGKSDADPNYLHESPVASSGRGGQNYRQSPAQQEQVQKLRPRKLDLGLLR